MICLCSQTSHFKVFPVHDDVIETEQHREPILDHRVLDANILRACGSKTALWCVQHDRNNASEHGNRKQTDLLVLANLAKVGDAYRQVSECAVADDGHEVFLIQAGNDFKRRVCYSFCSRELEIRISPETGKVTCRLKL